MRGLALETASASRKRDLHLCWKALPRPGLLLLSDRRDSVDCELPVDGRHVSSTAEARLRVASVVSTLH